jgi:hypothetical protein
MSYSTYKITSKDTKYKWKSIVTTLGVKHSADFISRSFIILKPEIHLKYKMMMITMMMMIMIIIIIINFSRSSQ